MDKGHGRLIQDRRSICRISPQVKPSKAQIKVKHYTIPVIVRNCPFSIFLFRDDLTHNMAHNILS